MRTSVRDVLDVNRGLGPGFHLLRHGLAISIVLFHCRQAIWWTDSSEVVKAAGRINTGLSRHSNFTLDDVVRPGIHSLIGLFFALSGFLVAGSALRTGSTGRFLINRGLRIFPGLGVETVLSALILGPLVTVLPLSTYFTSSEFLHYLGNVVGWVHFTLPGVFGSNPLPYTVNGQLWTLPSEFWCYLLMAVMMITGLISRRGILLAIACVALLTMCALYLYDPITYDSKGENFFTAWYIVALFWFGVVYYLFADKVPLRPWLLVASTAAYWCIMFFNIMAPLAGIPLTYIMVYVGMTAFPWWDRLVKSDYSYGIYLYHFPIIQTLMWLMKPTLFAGASHGRQLAVLFPGSLAITVLFAAMSWRFVEKPALGLRTVFARTKAVTGQPAPAVQGHGEALLTPSEQVAEARSPGPRLA